MKARQLYLLKWGGGPLVTLLLGLGLGIVQSRSSLGSVEDEAQLAVRERANPMKTAPLRAVVNGVWAMGNEKSVERLSRLELSQLTETDASRKAQLLVRLGLMQERPDAQASLFGSACSLDPQLCADLPAVAGREADARFVPPGNVLPLSLVGGHPPISGPAREPRRPH